MGRIVKRIYWNKPAVADEDGKVWATVHILEGYCPDTLDNFQRLTALLQETFDASAEEIHCGKVHTSDWCKNFTIISWRGKIKKQKYEDWTAASPQQLDYSF